MFGQTVATASVTGLTNGTAYTLSVYAFGDSHPGARSADATATPGTDYDTDDDGLIEVDSLAKFNAIRWDLDGDGASTNTGHSTAFPNGASALGCPDECKGYELTANLDFDTGTAGDRTDDTYWNSGAGWTPIGPYTGAFDGARATYTISNLYIDTASGSGDVGLFSSLGAGADVSDVALEDVDIRGAGGNVGAVAGKVGAATGSKAALSDSYSTGSIAIASGGVSNDLAVGGVAGRIEATGEVSQSYSWAWVTAHNTDAAAARRVLVGGVAGHVAGTAKIVFSRGRIVGHGTGANQVYAGGVFGGLNGGDIRAVYATGHVVADGGGTTYAGGLLGGAWGTSGKFYNGYFRGKVKVTNAGATSEVGAAVGLFPSGWPDCDSLLGTPNCIDDVFWDIGRTGISGTDSGSTGWSTSLFNQVVPGQGFLVQWNADRRGYGQPWDGGSTSEPPFFKTSIIGGTKADQLNDARGKVTGVTVTVDTNSTAATKADDKLDVAWTAVSGADSYRVQWRAGDSLFTPGREKVVTGQATASYEIPAADIAVGPAWSVRVIALASGRPDGEPSDEATAAIGNDYDADDDGYVDIDSLAKLNALRWDLDADGAVAAADKSSFGAGYPDALTGMGCPSTGCLGYELTAGLDFDTDGDGTADSGDAYWNGGKGWLPIGLTASFTGVLEGNDNTLSNLFVNRISTATAHDGGLFGSLGSHAEVRNLTLSGVSVTQTGATVGTVSAANAGALAGSSSGDVTDVSSSGAVTARTLAFSGGTAQAPTAGGLVGRQLGGEISDSSSVATVDASQGDADAGVTAYAGGLAGRKAGGILESSWASSPGVTASVNAATGAAQASAGGLVGRHDGGTTQAVYAFGDATAQSSGTSGQSSVSNAGGLVGQLKGGTVRAAYANATAVAENKSTTSGYAPELYAGGLVGLLEGGAIVASYALGAPALILGADDENKPFAFSLDTLRGGLVGKRTSGTTTDSYWDTSTTGVSTTGQGTSKTTTALQTPTAYGTGNTDIYADWDIDLDTTRSGVQDAWEFGTSSQYPVLTYGALTAAPQRTPLTVTVNAVSGSNSALRATWTVDAGVTASGFRVQWRSSTAAGAWSSHAVTDGAARRYTMTGLETSALYDVRVALRGSDGGYGPPSGIVQVSTGANVDYDFDDDGLIEVGSLAQLNAVRWDLDGNGTAASGKTTEYAAAFPKPLTGMGCPSSTCTGYELDEHLDFDTDNSGAPNTGDDYWDSGRGWLPIGATAGATASTAYSGDFDGNSYVISNLFVNRSAAATTVAHGGLFARIASGAEVSDVHLEGVSVTVSLDSGANTIADVYVGAVAGRNAGDISGSYATGTVKATQTDAKHAYAGGLVGESSGSIEGSYARATVTAHQASTANSLVGYAGGIAGRLASGGTVQAAFSDGSVTARSDSASTGLAYAGGLAGYSQGTLKASYSHAAAAAVTSATAQSAVLTAGGLVGHQKGGSIAASYATGAPSSSGGATPTVRTGGLAGHTESTPTVTNSYWDATRSSQSTSAAGTSKTTSQLQSPTAYGTGSAIYAGWNLNLDGVTGNDDPWDFGTAAQYPVLDWGGHAVASQRASVTLAISPATICESARGTGGSTCGAMPVTSAAITATLSPARLTDVTVTLTDPDNTTTQAAAIYTLSSATLTIAAGATTATATVTAVNNSVEALDKTVQWNAASSDPQVQLATVSVSLTITDEDSVAAPRARASSTRTPNDEVKVDWTAVTGADGYYVQWKSGAQAWSSSDRQQTVAGGASTTYTKDDLTTNTQYTFRVIAYRTGFDDSAPSNEVRATPGKVTYDTDYDGLIEISSAAQLNAVRWDLDGDGTAASGKATQYATAFPDADTGMGCPTAGCDGYELSTDIDLDTDGDGTADSGDAYWNNGAGWTPIGAWAAEFDGNLHEVQNLFVNSSASAAANVGLFSEVGASGEVRRLGVTAASVTAATSSGDIWVGILAGKNSGTVLASWTTGAVTARSTASASSAPGAGGLVGWNTKIVRGAYSNAAATATANGTSNSYVGGLAAFNDSGGRVEASHATGAALANGTPVSNTLSVRSTAGGLLARNKGEVTAAYATGNATARGLDATAGGLVGSNETRDLSAQTGGQITAAYAVGTPTATAGASGTAYTGGLVARNQLHATASDSYWDSAASGTTSSAVGTAKTTTQLQTPTDYGTGSAVYANWNLNVDGISGTDDPWDFGTSSQYPLLSWGALHGDIADATLPTLSWAASRTTICESTKGTAATACNLSPAHTTSVLTPTLSAAFGYDVVFTLPSDASLYTLSAPTVTIPAGATTATGVTLTAVNNKVDLGAGASPEVSLTPPASHVWLTASVPAITIADDDELPAPSGLRLSVGPVSQGTHKVRVDWNAVSGTGISYLVEWNTAQSSGWDSPTGSATSTATSHTISGLTAGTAYWVRVTARGTGVDDSLPSSLAGTVSGADYDTDDDGLIEIASQAQLNAIRWDLNGDGVADSGSFAASYASAFPGAEPNMGCSELAVGSSSSTGNPLCIGYELKNSITLTGLSGAGWLPIPGWSTVLDGSGFTISGLTINRSGSTGQANAGLFAAVNGNGTVMNLGLRGVSITTKVDSGSGSRFSIYGGAVAGTNSGVIAGSHATGTITVSQEYGGGGAEHAYAGGLVGQNSGVIRSSYARATVTAAQRRTHASAAAYAGGIAANQSAGGSIAASFSSGSVTASTKAGTNGLAYAGGLLGYQAAGSVTAAYSHADPTATGDAATTNATLTVGGLIGHLEAGSVTAAYATGAPAGSGGTTPTVRTGGLAGHRVVSGTTVTNSYWDSERSGVTAAGAGAAKTTAQLQSPVAYGVSPTVYADWNLNLDGVAGADDPWDFGTAAQYPALKYGLTAADQRAAVTLTAAPAAICESTAGSNAAACGASPVTSATLSAAISPAQIVPVTVAVAGVAGQYTVSGASITIAAGATAGSATATVTAVDNTAFGADSAVTVTGDSAQDWVAVTGASLTIRNDDLASPVASLVPQSSLTSVGVSWAAVANAGGYRVEWNTSATQGWATPTGSQTLGSAATSHTITGLTASQAYWVRVIATATGWSPSAPSALLAFGPPAAPAPPELTGGIAELTATWTAPAANGSALVDYDVQYRACTTADTSCATDPAWGSWADRSGETAADTALSAKLSGLTRGTAYQVRVRAANGKGEGAWSLPSAGVQVQGGPGLPGNISGTWNSQTPTTLDVSWTSPGGSYLEYDVVYRVDADEVWAPGRSYPATGWQMSAEKPRTETTSISGLDASATYVVAVRALSRLSGLRSSWAISGLIEPAGTPNRPSGISETARTTMSLSLQWSKVSAGATVAAYDVRVSEHAGVRAWATAASVTQPSAGATVSTTLSTANLPTGFSDATTYVAQVRAKTASGTCGQGGVLCSRWVESGALAQLDIKGLSAAKMARGSNPTYVRTPSVDMDMRWDKSSVEGATYEVAFYYRVGDPAVYYGKSDVNASPGSRPDSWRMDWDWWNLCEKHDDSVPSDVSPVLSSRGCADHRGRAVYYMPYWEFGRSTWGSWMSLSAADAKCDGDEVCSYTFADVTTAKLTSKVRVRAVVDGTKGPVSEFTSLPPRTPGSPYKLTATAPTGASFALCWNRAFHRGSAIVGFDIELFDTTAPATAAHSVTGTWGTQVTGAPYRFCYTFRGIATSKTYYAKVRAQNGVGYSGWTQSDNVVLAPTAPPAPAPATVSVSGTTATLSWTAPTDDGGAAVTAYKVQYRKQNADSTWPSSWTDHTRTGTGATTTESVGGLTAASTYEFRVLAVNSVGDGAWSIPVEGAIP